MISREELRGEWNQVKGRLMEHWGQLTDEDLRKAQGQAERLVGIIQERTGASRHEIEQFLDRAVQEASGLAAQVSEAARHYTEEANEAIRIGAERAAASASDASKRLSEGMSRRPIEAIAVAFTVGVAAGLLLMINRRR